MRRIGTKEVSVIPPAADIPCAADAPDLGQGTKSPKREHDQLVNRRTEMMRGNNSYGKRLRWHSDDHGASGHVLTAKGRGAFRPRGPFRPGVSMIGHSGTLPLLHCGAIISSTILSFLRSETLRRISRHCFVSASIDARQGGGD
jgi:hypothetical protein